MSTSTWIVFRMDSSFSPPLNCIFKLLKQTELITYPVRADKNGGFLIVEVMFLSEVPDYLNIIMHNVQFYSLSTVFSYFLQLATL